MTDGHATSVRLLDMEAEDVRGWHGWKVGDVALHVGPLPGRRSVCLYAHIGTTIEPLAYFTGERGFENACRTLAILDRIVHARCTHNDGTACTKP